MLKKEKQKFYKDVNYKIIWVLLNFLIEVNNYYNN